MSLKARTAVKSAAYALGLALMAIGAANANTLPLNVNTAATADPIANGNLYDTGEVHLTGGTVINAGYFFTGPVGLFTTSIESPFHPTGSGDLGILNGTAQWFASTSVSGPFSAISPLLQVTNASGVETSIEPTLFLSLPAGFAVYELVLGGTTESGGGNYDLSVQATPLPAAALLFGSVLAGAGLLSRRRRARALNSQAA